MYIKECKRHKNCVLKRELKISASTVNAFVFVIPKHIDLRKCKNNMIRNHDTFNTSFYLIESLDRVLLDTF